MSYPPQVVTVGASVTTDNTWTGTNTFNGAVIFASTITTTGEMTLEANLLFDGAFDIGTSAVADQAFADVPVGLAGQVAEPDLVVVLLQRAVVLASCCLGCPSLLQR